METSPHVADWTDIVHSDWEASGVIWNSMELDYLRRQFQFENSLLAIVAISSYVVGWLSVNFPVVPGCTMSHIDFWTLPYLSICSWWFRDDLTLLILYRIVGRLWYFVWESTVSIRIYTKGLKHFEACGPLKRLWSPHWIYPHHL